MKFNLKRISRRALSLVLCLLMMFSTLMVGMVSTVNADTITSDGNARLYFNMKAVSWWIAGNNGDGNFAYFFNNSTGVYKWSAHAVKYSGDIYYVIIPSGSWEGVILTRNNTSTSPNWNNKWNKTGDITLSTSSNYISKFSEGSESVTWGTQKPTSTGSLTASKTTASVGEAVTLTPKLTSNTDINTLKSTTYSISPTSGASIIGDTFTATAAGTYTVTATITYYPNAYSSITSTVKPTATITVTSADHKVTVAAGSGGTVTPSGQQTVPSAGISVTATPDTGFKFKDWSVTGGAKVASSTSATTTVTATADGTVTANFEKVTYAVNVSLVGATGTAPATQNVVHGDTATFTANAIAGYEVEGWYSDSACTDLLGTGNSYTTGSITAAKTIYLKYKAAAYNINVNNNAGATVTGVPATATYGSSVSFTVTPKAGYSNVVTIDGVTPTVSGNTYTFKMPAKDVTINIDKAEIKYTVTASATNGTVSPTTGQSGIETPVTIKATPSEGYVFVEWKYNESDFTNVTVNGNEITVNAAKNAEIEAIFAEKEYTVTAVSSDTTMGTVSPETDTVTKVSKKVTITATPKEGYELDSWSYSGHTFNVVKEGNTITLNAATVVTITANFKEIIHTATATSENEKRGTVSPATSEVGIATATTVTATPKAGYEFDSWVVSSGNIQLHPGYALTDETINFNATEDVVLIAQFKEIISTVTVTADSNGSVANASVQAGPETAAEIKAIANSKYRFVEWQVVSGSVTFADETSATTTITATADSAVKAIFEEDTFNKPTLESTANAAPLGTEITLTATPDKADEDVEGIIYHFFVGGKEVQATTSNTYTFKLESAPLDCYVYLTADSKYSQSENSNTITITEGLGYKGEAYTYGLWVDARPDYNSPAETNETLIIYNYRVGEGTTGGYTINKHNSKNLYTFYLPATVDMDEVHLYHAYKDGTVSIGSQNIISGGKYAFDTNTIYDLKTSAETAYVRFLQGSKNSAQMYFKTKTDLPDHIYSENKFADFSAYKDSVETKGNVVAVGANDSSIDNYVVKKLKGRGNSSWEASCREYGKYAFNLTIDDADADGDGEKEIIDFLGLVSSNKNKNKKGNTKYSLLATTMDETQMRNSFVYKLAEELGFKYYPNYQMADFYDNGIYMGSYLVCQKIELGKKGLINEPEVDNGDPVDANGEETDPKKVKGSMLMNYKTSTVNRQYQYVTNLGEPMAAADFEQSSFLLEFELQERYTKEASWFQSGAGQFIVVTSPEYATQDQMKFVMGKWNEVEHAVYNKELASVSDKIDIESFAKMYLIQELTKNLDGCATSFNVIYKAYEGKFYAEPVWDYDWTLGGWTGEKSLYSGDSSKTDKNNNPGEPLGFFAKYKSIEHDSKTRSFLSALCMSCDVDFWPVVEDTWENLFYDVASSNLDWLSTYREEIKDTVEMNEARWKHIATDPTAVWKSTDTGDTFDDCADWLIDYTETRLDWLDWNVPSQHVSSTYTLYGGKNNFFGTAYDQYATHHYLLETEEGSGVYKIENIPASQVAGSGVYFAIYNGTSFIGPSGKTLSFVDGVYTASNCTAASGSYNNNITLGTKVAWDRVSICYEPSTNTIWVEEYVPITYASAEENVTYYVDMHDVEGTPTVNGITLAQQGTSSVYAATLKVTYQYDSEDESKTPVKLDTAFTKVTIDGTDYNLATSLDIVKLIENKEVWFEVVEDDSPIVVEPTYTTASNSNKRIYFNNNSIWSNVYAYVWNKASNTSEKAWPGTVITSKKAGNYYYYDVDISKYDYIIFNGGSGKLQTSNLAIGSWNMVNSSSSTSTIGCPVPTSYYTAVTMTVGANANIKPSFGSNVSCSYSSDNSIVSVSSDGIVTATGTGTAKVTVTLASTTSGYTGVKYTYTTTITVDAAPTGKNIIVTPFAYDSAETQFSAEGGEVSIVTKLSTPATFFENAGIITLKDEVYTVKYAVADEYELTITTTASIDKGEFDRWTLNGADFSTENPLNVVLGKADGCHFIAHFIVKGAVKFTYLFKDYDTSDGNFKYDPDDEDREIDASYSTYCKDYDAEELVDDDAIRAALEQKITSAEYLPIIQSNYFDYSLGNNYNLNVVVDADNIITEVQITLSHTPHLYTFSVNGKQYSFEGKPVTYYYQEEITLNAVDYDFAEDDSVYWYVLDGDTKRVVSTDVEYTFNIVIDGMDLHVEDNDGSVKMDGKSSVANGYYELSYAGTTQKLTQNFYIINYYTGKAYNDNGEEITDATNVRFLGAGVVYYSLNASGAYYPGADSYLSQGQAGVKQFIYDKVVNNTGVNSTIDVTTDTATKIGYRYLTLDEGKETVYRYSNTIEAYHYIFALKFTNNEANAGKSMAMYSYYIYQYKDADGKTQTQVAVSDTCAKASVYEASAS